MGRLILFGCSQSRNLYEFYFSKYSNVVDRTVPGYSNMNIMADVYNWINEDSERKSYSDYENDVLLIQYSYTNRWWRKNSLPDSKHGFHSFEYISPIYDGNEFAKEDLKKYYELYLTYFWDYEPALKQHIQDIDFFKSYLEVKNINYLHFAWTDYGNPDETRYIKDVEETTLDSQKMFKDLGCISIDDNYLIGHWARNKKIVDPGDHIYNEKNYLLGEKLEEKIKNKYQINLYSN